MDSEVVYEFDYLYMNEVKAHVKLLTNGRVEVENYVDNPLFLPFGVNQHPTLVDLDRFYESRCFPETRFNCKEVLESGGMTEYIPYNIVRETRGFMVDSCFWIRFDNEPDLTFEDLRKRFM